jgi:hypothetical protein
LPIEKAMLIPFAREKGSTIKSTHIPFVKGKKEHHKNNTNSICQRKKEHYESNADSVCQRENLVALFCCISVQKLLKMTSFGTRPGHVQDI